MIQTKTGLVLQGGGALGAYQWGVIAALESHKEVFSPAVVTGVSIGAVNAAVYLSSGVEGLAYMWNKVKMKANPFFPQEWQAKRSKWANPSMYYPNPELLYKPFTAESVYNLSPFKKLLNELIDIKKINQSETRLVIEAVNIETGDLARFSNHNQNGISIDQVIASMSIPPNFPMVEVDNGFYWDGGLFANMPLAPAINYLESFKGQHINRNLIIINLFRKRGKLPQTLEEVSDRIKEIIFESKLKSDQKIFRNMDCYIDLAEELDKTLPADSPIRKMLGFKKLIAHEKINAYKLFQYLDEGVEGTDDFMPDSIDSRYRRGYNDAKDFLNKQEHANT
ncbi:MAG: patatin-like phospholipase family protein [Bernardetiaceae bacterium]|nr:patatin-like phospholipase family protein [Bernardetiaceae bacterium]